MGARPDSGMSVATEENVPMETRDGTILKADIYRPSRPGRFPVLLCRTPYDKSKDTYIEVATKLASRGYIVATQDIRGRYASDGEFFWQFQNNSETYDTEDGYDAVNWADSLPGSDGQVGTWGHSYASWCIWRLAASNPSPLKAIFASGMGANLLRLNFGVFETGRRLQWTYQNAADARRRAGDLVGPYTSEEAEKRWYEVERGKWLWYLPLDDIPDYVFSTMSPMLKKYLREQDKEFWAFREIHNQVNAPTCVLTGWWDRLVDTISNFEGMVENGPKNFRKDHRIIIGPWGHNSQNLTRNQGPLDFGPSADTTYTDEITRWYDYHYKSIDTGIASEPPVKLFVIGENKWRFEHEWPLARTRYTDFFLHSDGSANTVFGNGLLSTSEPGVERPDEYNYDPRDPIMSMMDITSQAAPRDQAPLNGRQDILVYQTPPLEAELEVIGPVRLTLWAASSAPDTDFTAKLIDVHPNGLAINLCYGIIRARYRNGYDAPTLIEPGRPYEYTINMMPTGIRFGVGHRIRLDVASSDFPNFDRNHNTGKDFWSDSELRVARQTVYHEQDYSSRLTLPVIPG